MSDALAGITAERAREIVAEARKIPLVLCPSLDVWRILLALAARGAETIGATEAWAHMPNDYGPDSGIIAWPDDSDHDNPEWGPNYSATVNNTALDLRRVLILSAAATPDGAENQQRRDG